jgi:hypothetical protein
LDERVVWGLDSSCHSMKPREDFHSNIILQFSAFVSGNFTGSSKMPEFVNAHLCQKEKEKEKFTIQ